MKKFDVTSMFYKKDRNVCGMTEGDAIIVASAEAAEAVANVAAAGTAVTLGGSAVVYAHTLSKTGNKHKAVGFACFAAGVGSIVTDKVSRKVGRKVFNQEKARLMRPTAPVNEAVADETLDVEYVEA